MKEDLTWNPSKCAYDTDEYLKLYSHVRSFIDDLVVTYDGTVNNPETASLIDSINKKKNIK